MKWLAEKGYDSRMGARPLGRVIQEHIKKPLADEVLFGKLKKGGTVKVDRQGRTADGLDLEAIEDGPVTPKPEPTPRKARGAARAASRRRPRQEDAAADQPAQRRQRRNGGRQQARPGAQGAAEDRLRREGQGN